MSYCGANCAECDFGKGCGCRGCEGSGGAPFGRPCMVAGYTKAGDKAAYDAFVRQLLTEINALAIPGLPEITRLFPLVGAYVNLAYPLPGGTAVKFLDDNEIYLGCQAECTINDGTVPKCFGVVAHTDFLLICEYGENGTDPELILYKHR